MKKINDKVMPGWYIPKDVKESFVNFCTENGSVIQDSAAGAFVIWQHLPSLIRESAMKEAKGTGKVDKKFWADFCMGIELGMRAQLKNLRQKQPEKNS